MAGYLPNDMISYIGKYINDTKDLASCIQASKHLVSISHECTDHVLTYGAPQQHTKLQHIIDAYKYVMKIKPNLKNLELSLNYLSDPSVAFKLKRFFDFWQSTEHKVSVKVKMVFCTDVTTESILNIIPSHVPITLLTTAAIIPPEQSVFEGIRIKYTHRNKDILKQKNVLSCPYVKIVVDDPNGSEYAQPDIDLSAFDVNVNQHLEIDIHCRRYQPSFSIRGVHKITAYTHYNNTTCLSCPFKYALVQERPRKEDTRLKTYFLQTFDKHPDWICTVIACDALPDDVCYMFSMHSQLYLSVIQLMRTQGAKSFEFMCADKDSYLAAMLCCMMPGKKYDFPIRTPYTAEETKEWEAIRNCPSEIYNQLSETYKVSWFAVADILSNIHV